MGIVRLIITQLSVILAVLGSDIVFCCVTLTDQSDIVSCCITLTDQSDIVCPVASH